MANNLVESGWFRAAFPGPVKVSESPLPSARGTVVTYEAEIQPFGMFTVDVTHMPVNIFIAAGADKWIGFCQGRMLQEFAGRSPRILTEEARDGVPGMKVKDLVFQFDYEGPCLRFCRIITVLDGVKARTIEASAVVDSASASQAVARSFLRSLEVTPPQLPQDFL